MPLDALDALGDDALMVLFANGDPSAARELTRRQLPRVLALTRRMLQNEAEAEDAAQDAMLKLWKAAPDWTQGKAKLSTWLYRVTYNHCIDLLRKRRTTVSEDAESIIDQTPGAEAQLVAKNRADALSAAMDSLPERQRVAMQLRHFEECSNIEIAEIMETTVEAIESLLGRGKRALADQLYRDKDKLGLA